MIYSLSNERTEQKLLSFLSSRSARTTAVVYKCALTWYIVYHKFFCMGLRVNPYAAELPHWKKLSHFFFQCGAVASELWGSFAETGIAWQYPFWQKAHFCFDISCQNRYCVTISVLTNRYIFSFRGSRTERKRAKSVLYGAAILKRKNNQIWMKINLPLPKMIHSLSLIFVFIFMW